MTHSGSVPTTDKNRHVREYLSYYVSLAHPPNYAVMINGPWGVGKTYATKSFCRTHFANENKVVYVSLYGLATVDDIDDALFQAIYPALSWRATRLGARVGKTLLRRFGFDSDFRISDVLSKFDADLHVFDDLERCEAPINTVLGYINEFVEHGGGEVIIIANEEEIANREEYLKRREKLIGKTLEVRSAFEAFRYFVSLIDDRETKSLFEKNTAEIASIYVQSGIEQSSNSAPDNVGLRAGFPSSDGRTSSKRGGNDGFSSFGICVVI